VPLTAELAYNHGFWTSAQVMEPNGGAGPPSSARPSYDQLLVTVGVGVMR
jgi:hypothetical protein